MESFWNNIGSWLTDAKAVITVISLTLSAVALAANYKRIWRAFVYRHIRRILGIRDGDKVLVVCSELPDATARQMVEDREYIYLMKYGDLDAWVELIFSLLRIYPNIDLQVMSSGEALSSRVDLGHQILLIGGTDYNLLVRRIHDMGANRVAYTEHKTDKGDEEIALKDKVTGQEYFFTHLDKDYGYIERISNPFDLTKQMIFFGGCHTVGVTSATKFMSAFSEGRQHVSTKTLINAAALSKMLKSERTKFFLLIEASKIGSSIASPSFQETRLFVDAEPNPVLFAKQRAPKLDK